MTIKFDYSKLKGRIIEKGLNQMDLCKLLPMAQSTFISKMKCKVDFRQEEIIQLSKILEIPDCQIPLYFFCKDNSENREI